MMDNNAYSGHRFVSFIKAKDLKTLSHVWGFLYLQDERLLDVTNAGETWLRKGMVEIELDVDVDPWLTQVLPL